MQNSVLTLASFKPITIIDSLAASIILSGAQTLEQGHMELANNYESRGELEKAFDDYHALIYIVPYFDLFYKPAVEVLVEMKKYNEALEVLQGLLKYQ